MSCWPVSKDNCLDSRPKQCGDRPSRRWNSLHPCKSIEVDVWCLQRTKSILYLARIKIGLLIKRLTVMNYLLWPWSPVFNYWNRDDTQNSLLRYRRDEGHTVYIPLFRACGRNMTVYNMLHHDTETAIERVCFVWLSRPTSLRKS